MLPHLKRLELLLTELRRRRVFRAAAFYAVAAWALSGAAKVVTTLRRGRGRPAAEEGGTAALLDSLRSHG